MFAERVSGRCRSCKMGFVLYVITLFLLSCCSTEIRCQHTPVHGGSLGCDFEGTNICGYTQDRTDMFDWTRRTGPTGSSGTGPTSDHTYATLAGHYMYIETSAPRRAGDTARLISQMYTPPAAAQCLEFWYHMYGNSVGSLNVYFQVGRSLGNPKFTKHGTQGNKWIRAHIVIPSSSPPFQLVFEGIRGTSYSGDLAIDDIAVKPAELCGISSGRATNTSMVLPTKMDTESSEPATTEFKLNESLTTEPVTTASWKNSVPISPWQSSMTTALWQRSAPSSPLKNAETTTPGKNSMPTTLWTLLISTDMETTLHAENTDSVSVPQSVSGPENAIQTGCEYDRWDIAVNVGMLKRLYPNITLDDIYLGVSNCIGKSQSDSLLFQQGFNSCSTTVAKTNVSTIYQNKLIYAERDPTYTFIIRRLVWDLPVKCKVPRIVMTNATVHHDGHHLHESVITPPPAHTPISLQFFSDKIFLHPIPGPLLHVNVGDVVYVKVLAVTQSTSERLILRSCYTKPTADAPDNQRYYIIKNGCATDPNVRIISRSTHETRFSFQEFEYASNHDGLKIYCEATFCDVNDKSSGCVTNCQPDYTAIIG